MSVYHSVMVAVCAIDKCDLSLCQYITVFTGHCVSVYHSVMVAVCAIDMCDLSLCQYITVFTGQCMTESCLMFM